MILRFKDLLTKKIRLENIQTLYDIFFSIIAALLITIYCNWNDWRGDLIVQSIISQENVTFYFWGQDRFFNLVPLLGSLIKDSILNLKVLGFLNCFGMTSLIMALARFCLWETPNSKKTTKYRLVWLLSLLSIIFILSPEEKYYFFKDAQPYAWSTLFFVFVSVRSFKEFITSDLDKIFIRNISIPNITLAFLSLSLTPTTILPGLVSAQLGLMLLKPNIARRTKYYTYNGFLQLYSPWIFGLIIKRFIDLILGSRSSLHYLKLGNYSFIDSLFEAIDNTLRQRLEVSLVAQILFIISLTFGLVMFFYILLKPDNKKIAFNYIYLISLASYAAFAFLLFPNLNWVQANQFHFRYLFPIYILWIYSLLNIYSVLLLKLEQKFNFNTLPLNLVHLNRAFWLFAILALPLILIFKPIPENQLFINAKKDLQIMRSYNLNIISGTYWRTWPVYFLSLADSRESKLGITSNRSEGLPGNRDLILAELSLTNSTKRFGLCVATPAKCKKHLRKFIKTSDKLEFKPILKDKYIIKINSNQ